MECVAEGGSQARALRGCRQKQGSIATFTGGYHHVHRWCGAKPLRLHAMLYDCAWRLSQFWCAGSLCAFETRKREGLNGVQSDSSAATPQAACTRQAASCMFSCILHQMRCADARQQLHLALIKGGIECSTTTEQPTGSGSLMRASCPYKITCASCRYVSVWHHHNRLLSSLQLWRCAAKLHVCTWHVVS